MPNSVARFCPFASRSDGRVKPVEAESRLVHDARRKRVRVTQHGAAIVDHLRKELVGREVAVVRHVRHVQRHDERSIARGCSET